MASWKCSISSQSLQAVVGRLWYKGYDLSLDYGIYYSFHVVYGNNLNTLLA